jgi:hypothetical protein
MFGELPEQRFPLFRIAVGSCCPELQGPLVLGEFAEQRAELFRIERDLLLRSRLARFDPENTTIKTRVAVAEIGAGLDMRVLKSSSRCSPAGPGRCGRCPPPSYSPSCAQDMSIRRPR